MPLHLIHGPLNSGRRGLILERFRDALPRDPILVVPNIDDVFSFERELCEASATLGGAVTTFGGLFREVATAAGSPPLAELSTAQRQRAVSVAVARRRGSLGPLRRSAARPGFPVAFERLLDELQAAGLDLAQLGEAAETLESSAYLDDLRQLAGEYAAIRAHLGSVDSHQIAHEAITLLRADDGFWRSRPLFLYGLDDLTANQFDLIEAVARSADVTVAVPYEEGRNSLAARATLVERLRKRIETSTETHTDPDPANTADPLLFHIERSFGDPAAPARAPDGGLAFVSAAGVRGEAEAIGQEVARLVFDEADPAEIAIVLRDPRRHGQQLAAVLESYGIATALEAELPIAGTAVGGALIALLETEFGAGRASDLLRFLRGPSGVPPARVDWLERAVRRRRIQSAAAALELWQGEDGRPPFDLERIRTAAARSPASLAAEVGGLAATMASRPLRDGTDGPRPGRGDGLELRASAEIANALEELAELGDLAPRPEELAGFLGGLELRAWRGPVEGRVRIADPYRLRAARFDHVFLASLQDGEFPRRERGDPFLSEGQRESLGLEGRRDSEAEERYLFHTCLSLPRERLFLCYRESDEDGAAEARSPLVEEVRRLLSPAGDGPSPDPVEEAIVRRRDLADVVHPVAEAPSAAELARAIAAHGRDADAEGLLAAAAAPEDASRRVLARISAARDAEAASRAPGPLSNPAVVESLAAVSAHGGTTLEEFDLCSYRWFVSHELRPERLDPAPEPLVQGGLVHAALERLYRERPGGDVLPRPGSLAAWTARAQQVLAEIVAELELGTHPAERTMVRQVERLLARFLAEEARRESGGFEPWLLEAAFGEDEGSERPPLAIDGWALHGAVDRVDRAPDGRTLVIDYKLSSKVTAREKFEERAKLQLPLYLLAVAEHWGGHPAGAIYHPLRGTSSRRPRGVVLEEAAAELESYGLYGNDVVDEAGLEEVLEDARSRARSIVGRMRSGDIRRDPGPRRGLRGHGICPSFCEFAPICRRDRAPGFQEDDEVDER